MKTIRLVLAVVFVVLFLWYSLVAIQSGSVLVFSIQANKAIRFLMIGALLVSTLWIKSELVSRVVTVIALVLSAAMVLVSVSPSFTSLNILF